jgi:hypothetical protein
VDAERRRDQKTAENRDPGATASMHVAPMVSATIARVKATSMVRLIDVPPVR